MSSKDDNDDYRLSKPPAFDNEDFGIPDRHIERVPYDVAALVPNNRTSSPLVAAAHANTNDTETQEEMYTESFTQEDMETEPASQETLTQEEGPPQKKKRTVPKIAGQMLRGAKELFLN